ncbi:MAG: T9SS type A sorting domain-containing protein [Bacteroidales bacterium]|nr:T9SS type A sorting domain-containing protein [Bacteroidales bacterium]
MKAGGLFSIIIFLLSINSFSQPLWTRVLDAQEHNKSTAAGNALLNNSIILQAGYVGHGGYALPNFVANSLIAYDLDGNVLWHVSGSNDSKSPVFFPGGLFGLISSHANHIYAVGYNYDYWGESFLSFSKFDEQGGLVFQNKHFWENPYEYENMSPVSMDVYESKEIIIALHDNTVVKTDASGQFIWLPSYDFEIIQIGFFNNNSIFMMTDESLYLADLDGTILNAVVFEDACLEAVVHNDTIYQLFSNIIISLDADLQIIDTIPVSQHIALKSLKHVDDKLWVMGVKDQQIQMVKIENHAASEPLTFELLVQSPDFLIADSRFIFTGTSPSGQIAVYSYENEEEPDVYIWPDIELVDFTISNLEYEYIDTEPIAIYFDTEMTIYNNSDDVIETFAVFTTLMKNGVYAFTPFFYEKFTEYAIHPYEELTIQLPRMRKDDPPSHNNEFCFELLAPNSGIEPDISQNLLCKTFDIVSADDLQHSNSLLVYPNPAKDYLVVNASKDGLIHIALKNSYGQVVYDKTTFASEVILDISTLSPGLYLLTIVANNDRITKKVIKE